MKLISLLVIAVLSACSTTDRIENKQNETILGKWAWVSSQYYWPSDTVITPQSTGYSHTKTFLENGTVEIYRDDSLRAVYPYSIKHQVNTSGCDSLIINHGSHACFTVNEDSLMISTTYVDGPAEFYRRIN